jgi:hypothetical protein
MSGTPLGGTTPPGLFDNQPEPVIFDPDGTITNTEQQLKPFNSIVHIIKNDNTLNIFLHTRPTKTVVLILIFPKRTRDDITTFINDHILQQQSIHSFYLFFTNGQQHEVALRNLFTPLLIDCYSITHHLYSEVREALSTACDLNAKFCSRRAKEEEAQSNNSLVFIYEQQRRERLKLQIIYDNCLIVEIDKEHQ